MGKTKIKRRSKDVAVNPVGIPSIKELEKEEMSLDIKFTTDDVECLLDKLQGTADDKECAAYTIANMASNPTFVASMIEKKAIRIAAPLLVDRNPSVRHAIAGSLSNSPRGCRMEAFSNSKSADMYPAYGAADCNGRTAMDLFSEYPMSWIPNYQMFA